MDRFAVIGLGRFGSRLAVNLAAAGAEVIAIDRSRQIVEELRDRVTLAIALDATDEQALKIQGIDQVDCAIVGIGNDFEANALTTVLLKTLQVKRVVSRAGNEMQSQILTRIGADGVIRPEDESADRWSHRLLAPFLIDHVELGEGFALVQTAAPEEWSGKTLQQLDLRKNHKVTIVAIKRRVASSTSSGADSYEQRVIEAPLPTSRLTTDDILVIAGFDKDLERLPR
ncbi:MAG: TrkA family potassium uptake protein [Phycisphaerales bacterium]|nr:MAG: TrkA family potassium uptake protein [Phycisphaerales bacterium]